ncbi:MAG: MarR family transcriptional regulator [Sedimentibacter sp.]|uniref:MarR family winged helix-turn-helix transcriptional regulator n=1 Tax=Sedimentibacter sp. TaxID=1960295 RepID=UPI00298135B8|nr:MarR family transcriptional regulator [Sedimentibacter sp.]MDW5298678.1 MarR family transcriptional regulator [Sedimentibacter sp.]
MNKKFIEVVSYLEMLSVLRRIEAHKIFLKVGLYPGQLHLLEYIMNNDGCTQKEIADILRVSPASIATSTKRLQKSGLIEKKTDEDNLRKNMLSVTEKGSDLARKCRESFDVFDKKLFSDFSDEELSSMKNYLDRLILNITDGKGSEIDFCPIIALKNESKNNIKD